MKRKWLAVAVAVSMVVPACVWAQAPGGFGGGGSAMRNSPKRRLTGLVRNIGELEKARKAPLSKDQAKKVVAAIKPWQTRPKMTEDEAKGLYMKINAVLTTKQKNELDKMAAQNRRFGGGGRSGGRSGGWGGGSGRTPPSAAEMQKMRATMQKVQGFMKTSNPFYPPSKYKEVNALPDRMRQGFNRRYASQQALLAQLAKKAR